MEKESPKFSQKVVNFRSRHMLLVGIHKLHGTFRPFDSIQANMIATFLLPPGIGYLTVETKTFLISGC